MKLFKWLLISLSIIIVVGCGKDSDSVPDEIIRNSDYRNSFIYDKNSPYKSVLKDCISIKSTKNSCSLEKLPLLMQVSDNPTKEQIKQRLVVSHQWMGDRFLELLDILPNDIKRLLAATTAIVIDDDVIPAYYWSTTGAIYLDPRYLWLTPNEANTIKRKEDFRAHFGDDLKFYCFWRYVKNSKYAYRYYSLDKNITRTLNDIKYLIARLLYHELAHANDFTRKSFIEKVDKKSSIYDILSSNRKNRISTKLSQKYPLESKVLISLAKVKFKGKKATPEQKELSAKEVGDYFNEDGASDFYNYTNQYEDLAMLFEEIMMKYHFDIDRDVAFISKPQNEDNATYKDYIVAWGKRNRISDEQVAERALFVVKNILPNDTDWDEFFANKLNNSESLKAGENWSDSINIDNNISKYNNKIINKPKNINPKEFELLPL